MLFDKCLPERVRTAGLVITCEEGRLWKKDCLSHHIQVIIRNSPHIGAKRTVNGAYHE